MALSEDLKKICQTCNAPESFVEWLVQEELVETEDIALMARGERHVDAKIIEPSGLVGLRYKDKVVIRKVWTRCKANALTDINKAWLDRHGFSIGTHRFLTDGLFGKIFRDTNPSPPKFAIYFLEKRNLLNAIDPKKGQILPVAFE